MSWRSGLIQGHKKCVASYLAIAHPDATVIAMYRGGHQRTKRAAIALATALIATTACTPPHPANTPAQSTNADGATQAPDTAGRQAVIAQIRGVDVCALYGAKTAVAGRSLAVQAPRTITGCPAQIGAPAEDLSSTIYLVVGPPQLPTQESWVKHENIGDTEVSIADSQNAPNAPPRDQVVSSTCDVSARYPGSVVLSAVVSMPPAIDGCQIGKELMQIAIAEFAKRPPHGTSAAPRTVLTGIDPCRPIARLNSTHNIVWNIADTDTRSCAFTIDASPEILVSLEYLDPETDKYQPQHFQVNGHNVSGDLHDGIFNVVVGPQFPSEKGSRVPAMEIADLAKNMDRIKLLAQAIADDF
ncbi:Uncharacterised protein [Mycobacteroides abscessus subsp. abscessus]|nr:Uncharacterised protein [Mycobacteroides abscessus subsp. abscessus]